MVASREPAARRFGSLAPTAGDAVNALPVRLPAGAGSRRDDPPIVAGKGRPSSVEVVKSEMLTLLAPLPAGVLDSVLPARVLFCLRACDWRKAVMGTAAALVAYLDETTASDCPYGHVHRVVTGGAGGVANVHVVRVSRGSRHYHRSYDEVYYVLSGRGSIEIEGVSHPLRPGAVVVIPRGLRHSLEAADGDELEFVIFGTPAISVDDERARPRT